MESDRSEFLFDKGAPRFQPLWNAKLFAQRFDRLVKTKSWRISCQFEKHAPRLAKVYRMEIGSIQHRRHMQVFRDLFAPLVLRGIVLGAKRDVMDGSCSGATVFRSRIDDHIDMIPECMTWRSETQPVTLPPDFIKAQQVQNRASFVPFLLQQCHTEKTSDRMFRWNRRKTGGVCGGGVSMGDDFNLHAVRIGKGQHLLFETPSGLLHEHALISQPLQPVLERARGNAECGLRNFANTRLSARGVRPGKERQDRPG